MMVVLKQREESAWVLNSTRVYNMIIYQQARSLGNDIITSFYYYLQSATKVKPSGNDPASHDPH